VLLVVTADFLAASVSAGISIKSCSNRDLFSETTFIDTISDFPIKSFSISLKIKIILINYKKIKTKINIFFTKGKH